MDILDDYYEYLLDMMRFSLPEHRYFGVLLRDLFETPFEWVLPMDENREIDGFDLRREYLFDQGIDISNTWTDKVSVLEVLIALSRRIEIEIMGEPGNDHIERWFWIMLKNLGVLMRDNIYDHDFVMHKLDIWMGRNFNANGKGSIFPLRKAKTDQRDIDIWYQMQAYLNENYQI